MELGADEELASILNNIQTSSVAQKLDKYDEVFQDDEGLPTDRFLQALKSQAPLSELDILVTEKNTEPRYDENGVRVGLGHAVGKRYEKGLQKADVERKDGKEEYMQEAIDVLDDILGIRGSMESSDARYRTGKGTGASAPRQKSSQIKATASTSSRKTSTVTAKRSVKGAGSNKKLQRSKTRTASSAANGSSARNNALPPPPPSLVMRSTKKSAAAAAATTAARVVATEAAAMDDNPEATEAETKVRSLLLRCRGLQETVRVLEAQLNESQSAVTARDDAVGAAHARIRMLESRDQARRRERDMRTARNMAGVGAESLEEAVDKLKAQKDAVQVKLEESRAREKRVLERCRVLKEYGEKAKARVGELEGRIGELNRSTEDGERQRARYRKELRDLSAEAASATNALDQRDMELSEVKQRCEHLSNANRELHSDLDRSREDCRRYRMEVQSGQDRIRALETQVSLLKDKEAAGRAERSMRDTRAGRAFTTRRPPQMSAKSSSSTATASTRGQIRAEIERELEHEVGGGDDDDEDDDDYDDDDSGKKKKEAAGVTAPTLHWTRRGRQEDRDRRRSEGGSGASSAGSAAGRRSQSAGRGASGGGSTVLSDSGSGREPSSRTAAAEQRRSEEWSSTRWLRSAPKPKYDSDSARDGAVARRWAERSRAPLISRSVDVSGTTVSASERGGRCKGVESVTPSDRSSFERMQTVYDRVKSATASASVSRQEQAARDSSWLDSDSDEFG